MRDGAFRLRCVRETCGRCVCAALAPAGGAAMCWSLRFGHAKEWPRLAAILAFSASTLKSLTEATAAIRMDLTFGGRMGGAGMRKKI